MNEEQKKYHSDQLEVVNKPIKQEWEIVDKHIDELAMLMGKRANLMLDLGLREKIKKVIESNPGLKEQRYRGKRDRTFYKIKCVKCGKRSYTTNKETALKKRWLCEKCRK